MCLPGVAAPLRPPTTAPYNNSAPTIHPTHTWQDVAAALHIVFVSREDARAMLMAHHHKGDGRPVAALQGEAGLRHAWPQWWWRQCSSDRGGNAAVATAAMQQ